MNINSLYTPRKKNESIKPSEIIESELDETTQTNIKKYGINYKKIIENIICNNIVTE